LLHLSESTDHSKPCRRSNVGIFTRLNLSVNHLPWAPVLLVFKIFEKNVSVFQKIITFILWIYIYTCSEYSCGVLVEIALYFELQQKKLWLHIVTYICQKFIFLYSSKCNIFFFQIPTISLKFFYVYGYLISIFLKYKNIIFINKEHSCLYAKGTFL
jgi:hypothetical protein